MRRFLLLGTAGVLLLLLSAPRAWSFGWKDVIQMHEDSLSDELILEKIDHSGATFHLDAGELHQLKVAGVSDQVITAMLRTEDAEGGSDSDSGDDDGGYYGGGYYPYGTPYWSDWYDPYYVYPGGLYVGFGFGGGYGHYGRYRGHAGWYGRGGYGGRGHHGYGGRGYIGHGYTGRGRGDSGGYGHQGGRADFGGQGRTSGSGSGRPSGPSGRPSGGPPTSGHGSGQSGGHGGGQGGGHGGGRH